MTESEEPEHFEIPETLPLLPIRDLVVFPFMIVPLFVSRELSIEAVEEALSKDRMVFLATQTEPSQDIPTQHTLYKTGCVAMIMRMRKLPDGRIKILVQGLSRAVIDSYATIEPYFVVKLSVSQDEEADALEGEALSRNVKENLEKLIEAGKVIAPDAMMVISSVNEPSRLADLVASNLSLKVNHAQKILEENHPIKKLTLVNEALTREIDVMAMQQKIQTQAKEEMSRTQREYYLREQLKQIQNELGGGDVKTEEIDELRQKIESAAMPDEASKEAYRQLKRLEQMNVESSEAGVVRTYLDWLVELPWNKKTTDNLDLLKAKKILDDEHYDLEKVKERILEFLGVRKLTQNNKGPILCFVGPPGVGKTSLGKSIAHSMGREFVRISLGGVRDEAEIRGHRRTYVGALPGKIIQALKRANSKNPVFMLDEIDKVGADSRGDPAAALLEVLDPEQNNSFRDHYINLDFDLSEVLFIATANLIDPIPHALKDRMEIIRLAGYSYEEKTMIAKTHIMPKTLKENGLEKYDVAFSDKGLNYLITQYTKEAGLRSLEQKISSVYRKIARRVAENKKYPQKISEKNVETLLGPPPYFSEKDLEKDEVGVCRGLAWTQAGGEVLFIEATRMKGRGNLILTGQLGDIMKESAQAALTFARSNADSLGIDNNIFGDIEIHIHVPEGATPKDGPSAGITIATALISLLSGTQVKKDVAMTGEITLRGRVLPIGGLKEKLLAAHRYGITSVIIPKANERELIEIPPHILKQFMVIPAKTIHDVLEVALVNWPKIKSAQSEAPSIMTPGSISVSEAPSRTV